MSTNKKPRADAKLKTLPEERQAAIVEHMRSHKLAETIVWLREDGLSTSAGALSLFWDWWHLRRQFEQDEQTTDTLLEELKRDLPGLTEEQLDDLGQRTFSLLAIRRQDLGGFVKVRSARSKAELERAKLQLRQQAEQRLAEGLALQREKFQRETCALFLRWSEDQHARQIAAGTGSNTEKIEQLGRLMFGDDWK